MEILRGNAERGDFLREDGRPRGSWMGPSVKRPRRGWVDRQRRKDGILEETDSDADTDNDEDGEDIEVDDVEDDAEDEDADGEEDTDYDYLASQGQ